MDFHAQTAVCWQLKHKDHPQSLSNIQSPAILNFRDLLDKSPC